ncbi:TetR/AcrR family transcriptional regulator [Ekhidna sp.]|uniref:TetR/AcrR family transcriptional regulator n=1 Tax=Ekhidna sp. TaxID=2608089 RepID=UPI003BAD78F6
MNKRQQVINAATTLFSEKGFEKTSMNDICLLANVSKGLVYHHFASKNEILVEIFQMTTQRMKNMSSSNLNITPSERLVTLIDTIFTQLEKDKSTFKFNLNIMFQPSTRELLSSQLKERSDALFGSIKEVFDQVDGENSTTLSFMFIAELDGVAIDYLSVFEDYPLEAIKQKLISKYQSI